MKQPIVDLPICDGCHWLDEHCHLSNTGVYDCNCPQCLEEAKTSTKKA